MKINVSELASYAFCPERCKLILLGIVQFDETVKRSPARNIGLEMHEKLCQPYFSYEQRVVKHHLNHHQSRIYEREFDGHVLHGRFDNLKVETQMIDGEKKEVVTLIEYKTTSKKRFFRFEKEQAKFQLELYCWLMKPYFDLLERKLSNKHYIEVYSQQVYLREGRFELIDRAEITIIPEQLDLKEYLFDLGEERKTLGRILAEFGGLAPMKYPPEWKCKYCPKPIKAKCRLRHGFVA